MVDPMGSLCVRAAARHRAGAPQRPAERCAVGAERGRARVFPGAQLLTGALGAQPRAYERRGAVRALQCRLPGLPCMCFASGRLGCCGRLGRLLLRGGRQRGGQGCPIMEADTLTLVLIIPCAPACRRAPSCCWTSCRGCCPRCCAWSRPPGATRTPRRPRPRPRRPRRRRGRRRPRARRARLRGRAWRSARARPSRPARQRCRLALYERGAAVRGRCADLGGPAWHTRWRARRGARVLRRHCCLQPQPRLAWRAT